MTDQATQIADPLRPPSPSKPLPRQVMLRLLRTAISLGEWRYARTAAQAWLAAFSGDIEVQLLLAHALLIGNIPTNTKQAHRILQELVTVDPENLQAYQLLITACHRLKLDTRSISACIRALEKQEHLHKQKNKPSGNWPEKLHKAQALLLAPSASSAKGIAQTKAQIQNLIHGALADAHKDGQKDGYGAILSAVIHLRFVLTQESLPLLAERSLALSYHQRWPKCLPLMLGLAECLMENGEQEQAVALLHQAATLDTAGQTAIRLWGSNHPYRSLWPDRIEIAPGSPVNPQNIPIPAPVAAAMGWNQLPSGITSNAKPPYGCENSEHPDDLPAFTSENNRPLRETTSFQPAPTPKRYKPLPNSLKPARKELEQIAARLKLPHLARLDGRFPVYVIFTTRLGLQAQYGESGAALIDDQLKKLARAVRGTRVSHETWGAILFYADDPNYTSEYKLSPAAHNDAWGLKLILADLDQALALRGERIGAVLIIGGPKVVPFHHLPNPLDDADQDIPSDNPYATRDENYFTLEWPLGRIPGGEAADLQNPCKPDMILRVLQAMTTRYISQKKNRPLLRRIWQYLSDWVGKQSHRIQTSFGYSAAVWRRASLSVYRSIGEPHRLLVSPPAQACDLPLEQHTGLTLTPSTEIETACLCMPAAKLGYFNLHGVADAAEWFGQRDPAEPGSGPDFPIALRPKDLLPNSESLVDSGRTNGKHAPEVVFSEACYGAHIIGKCVEEALSLKFLASGSQAIVGSTCISYGSIGMPLMAADLLGWAFWHNLMEGLPAGESLRRAKLQLVREMHRRQGYLDGEDQKTVISFVLYGDPLSLPMPARRLVKSVPKPIQLPVQIQHTCDRSQEISQPLPVSPQMTSHIKQIVTQYLPGMENAEIELRHRKALGNNPYQNCTCNQQPGESCAAAGAEAKAPSGAEREVVTLHKSISQADHIHSQFARLTMDKSGKLLKLVISR